MIVVFIIILIVVALAVFAFLGDSGVVLPQNEFEYLCDAYDKAQIKK